MVQTLCVNLGTRTSADKSSVLFISVDISINIDVSCVYHTQIEVQGVDLRLLICFNNNKCDKRTSLSLAYWEVAYFYKIYLLFGCRAISVIGKQK